MFHVESFFHVKPAYLLTNIGPSKTDQISLAMAMCFKTLLRTKTFLINSNNVISKIFNRFKYGGPFQITPVKKGKLTLIFN